MENNTTAPQKIKNKVPYHPAIPLLGIFSKKMKLDFKRCVHVHCSIIHNGQGMEQTYVSISGWINVYNVVCIHTHWHTYTHIGILFSLKKGGNSDTCYNMNEAWGHDTK